MPTLRIINRNNPYHLKSVIEGGFEVIDVTRPGPLGNPYPLTNESERAEAIRLYERWLWNQIHSDTPQLAEIKRIIKALREGGKVALSCVCAPRACHAEIVKKAVKWVIARETPVYTEAALCNVARNIETFDWTYEMSDDHSVWTRGSNRQAGIIGAIKSMTFLEVLKLSKMVTLPKFRDDSPDFASWVRQMLMLD